jgi:flagellar biosynthesis protein
MAPDSEKPEKRARKAAVAMRYHPREQAVGQVVARGQGRLAEQIIELARAHGIPIKEDPDLVEILSRLQILEDVPPEIYILAAEMLGFSFRLNADWAGRSEPGDRS